MDLSLGNGLVETYAEEIFVHNVRIRKKDTLKPSFDVLPFWVNFKDKEDYLKLLDYGLFHIELEGGKILLDCKVEDIDFTNEDIDVKGYYSYARL